MEIRIANTAFNFLIMKCVEKKELDKNLSNEIGECILTAEIFYTNVALKPVKLQTSNHL